MELREEALQTGDPPENRQAAISVNLAQVLSWEDADEDGLLKAAVDGRRSIGLAAIGDPQLVDQTAFSVAAALDRLHGIIDDDDQLPEAIGRARRELDLLGPDHPDAPGYTANLIEMLRQLARETSDTKLLVDAVQHGYDTVAATCRHGNDRHNVPHLLAEGIDAGMRALRIFAEPGMYRAAALTVTSNCLRHRFVLERDPETFEQALERAREALTLTPENHPECFIPGSLSFRANTHHTV